MRRSGSAASAIAVKSRTSVKTTVIPSDSAKLCGDGIIDDPLDDLLRDKVRERPYGALRELHCTTKFVNFLNARCDWREVGRSQLLEFDCLSRYAFQGSRHSATKYPNDRNESSASDNCEDQSGELKPTNILSKVFLGRQQQYVGVVPFAQRDFRHSEQIVPPLVIADTSVVTVATKRGS